MVMATHIAHISATNNAQSGYAMIADYPYTSCGALLGEFFIAHVQGEHTVVVQCGDLIIPAPAVYATIPQG